MNATELLNRELNGISGIFGRLAYLASLQTGGRYRHSGLESATSAVEAHGAISAAHHALLEQVISVPIRELWEETSLWADSHGHSAADYLRPLLTVPGIVPAGTDALTANHFRVVADALAASVTTRA